MSSQELVLESAQAGHNLKLVSNNKFPESINAGAVSIEQERAIAEVQGQLIIAKRFKRILSESHAELMEACSSMAFAQVAFYSVPNRGTGPSIRFAEEVARVYGNFEFGHRELSRSEGKSEIEVYAWDKEKNNLSKRQITVMHVTDTRNGPKKLTDQADIDNKIANVASKQVRGRILALLPKYLVEDAIQKCKETLAGNTAEPISARVRKMIQAFGRFGVTGVHIERHLGHSVDETLLDELTELMGIYNALKEGTPASDFFGSVEAEIKVEETAAALAQSAQAAAKPVTPRQPRATKPKTEVETQHQDAVNTTQHVDAAAEPILRTAEVIEQPKADFADSAENSDTPDTQQSNQDLASDPDDVF